MNKLDELKKYMQAHPELAQKLENASKEDGIQILLDTNIFSSEEELLLALQDLHNQKLSDQELDAVNGGQQNYIPNSLSQEKVPDPILPDWNLW